MLASLSVATFLSISVGTLCKPAAKDFPTFNNHPASVMDMSFSDQALTAEWLLKVGKSLAAGLHNVPTEIDKNVATLKLASMGAELDVLTPAQELYLNSWEHGS